MLFAIRNASFHSPLYDYPILANKYGAVASSRADDDYDEYAIIRIDTLDALFQLQKDLGQSIILYDEKLDGYPILIIYDSWIE